MSRRGMNESRTWVRGYVIASGEDRGGTGVERVKVLQADDFGTFEAVDLVFFVVIVWILMFNLLLNVISNKTKPTH